MIEMKKAKDIALGIAGFLIGCLIVVSLYLLVPVQYRLWASLVLIGMLLIFIYADWPKSQGKKVKP